MVTYQAKAGTDSLAGCGLLACMAWAASKADAGKAAVVLRLRPNTPPKEFARFVPGEGLRVAGRGRQG